MVIHVLAKARKPSHRNNPFTLLESAHNGACSAMCNDNVGRFHPLRERLSVKIWRIIIGVWHIVTTPRLSKHAPFNYAIFYAIIYCAKQSVEGKFLRSDRYEH